MTHQLLPTLPPTRSLMNQIERKIDQLLASTAKKELPIIQTNLNTKQPYSLSIAIICTQNNLSSTSDFLNHVIRFNLIPGREFIPISVQHHTFSRQSLFPTPLLFAHYEFLINDNRDADLMDVYLPFLKQTLCLGLTHPSYAKNLEKAELLYPEQRNRRIHHYLAMVVQRYPKTKEILFPSIAALMTAASEMFYRHRTPRDLSRIFSSMVWVKHLINNTRTHPDDNIEIFTRFLSVKLNYTFGTDHVLGVVVAVSHLDEYQLLNERCILQSVVRYIPDAVAVKGSYIHFHQSYESPHLFYIEIKRKQGKQINLNERSLLKENLSQSIKASIEDVIPAAFVMNNEEEIMKNILTLRQELVSIDHPPQVIISFESHTTSHITFSVTLVRILEQDLISLNEAFREISEEWEYLPERKRIVSQEHDDFTKEAHVFHLRYRKSLTSNSDENSLNLHRSRQAVVNLLTEHLGPIRDYTGGVIVQQNTIFEQLKTRYSPLIQSHPGLIESFFYQLHPTDMVVVLPFEEIAQFFECITQVIDTSTQETGYTVYQKESEQALKIVVRIPNNMKEFLQQRLSLLEVDNVQILTTFFHYRGMTYFGLLACSGSMEKRINIHQNIQELLKSCILQEQNSQVLNICTFVMPPLLDPRISLHDANSMIFKLLFEGLMRLDKKGVPECALCHSYNLSDDEKTYTFHLRKCFWNTGDPITADDFVYSWKQVLNPKFATYNAFVLYPIKNAEKIRTGKLSPDQLGVKALDEQKLVVELEQPHPYFLHYLTLNLLFPVHHHIDQQQPDWPLHSGKDYPCNGPYILSQNSPEKHLQLVKNPHYWDNKHVRIDKIVLFTSQHEGVFNSYQKGKSDWLGMPFSPSKNDFFSNFEKKVSLPKYIQLYIGLNTLVFPLNNTKIRQALSLALDRESIAKTTDSDAQPAISPLHNYSTQYHLQTYTGDPMRAKDLFEEGLEEIKCTRKDFPEMKLTLASEVKDKRGGTAQLFKKQVYDILGINIRIIFIPWRFVYQTILNKETHLYLLNWKYLVDSPFYLLDHLAVQRYFDFPNWSNNNYIELLNNARQKEHYNNQKHSIQQLEKTLVEESPMLTLYYEDQYVAVNERLRGYAFNSKLGIYDLKGAYFKSSLYRSEDMIQWVDLKL